MLSSDDRVVTAEREVRRGGFAGRVTHRCVVLLVAAEPLHGQVSERPVHRLGQVHGSGDLALPNIPIELLRQARLVDLSVRVDRGEAHLIVKARILDRRV